MWTKARQAPKYRLPRPSVGAAFYAGDRPSSGARNRAPISGDQDDTISRYQEPTSAPARVADIPRSSHAPPTISGTVRPRTTKSKGFQKNREVPVQAPESGCLLGIVLWSGGASIPGPTALQELALGRWIPCLAGFLAGVGLLIPRFGHGGRCE
jgi:hypothetical protein